MNLWLKWVIIFESMVQMGDNRCSVKEVKQLTRRVATISKLLYLYVIDKAVSVVLVQPVREDQKPIYFMSKTLQMGKI